MEWNQKTEKKFNEFMKNTPSHFKTPFGEIVLRKELVKNILIDIRDLVKFDYDVFQVSQGDEGSGKTKFMSHLAFVYYYFLKELGIIEWEWSLDVCYGSLDKMLLEMELKRNIPIEFYVLDEGDELAGENYMQPNHKKFRREMRRGRKFSRLIFINLPQIKELSHRLITTRAQRVFEIQVDRDEQFNIVRGDWKMIAIPKGMRAYSYYNDEWISKTFIRNTLSNLLKSKEEFVEFPEKLVAMKGTFNDVDVWDPKEYKAKMIKETSEVFRGDFNKKLNENEALIILKVFEELSELRLISTIFKDNDNDRRNFYNLKKKLLDGVVSK